MKKIAITVLFLLLLSVSGVLADDKIAIVEEQWQERKDGVVVKDDAKVTKIKMPECTGATKPQVKEIVNKSVNDLRKDLLGDKKTGKQGAIGEVKTVAELAKTAADDAKNAADGAKTAADAAKNAADAAGASSAETKGAVVDLTTATKDHTKAIETNTGVIKRASENLDIQFWLLVGLMATVVFGLVGLGFFIASKIKGVTSGVKNAAEEGSKSGTILGLKVLDDKIDKLPDDVAKKTAEKMKEFNSEPFKYEAGGHDVIQTIPNEAVADKVYLLLHVPEGMNGDPATYHRDAESNCGVARRSCQKTMRRYFAGEFNGPTFTLQKTLIDHLISSGEIKY